jgi:hypothetical protein
MPGKPDVSWQASAQAKGSAQGEQPVVLVVLRLVEAIVLEHLANLNDLLALGNDDGAGKPANGGIARLFECIVRHDQCTAVMLRSIPSRNQVTRLVRVGVKSIICMAWI